MKVKVIKLDDRFNNNSQEEKERVGKVFEALKIRDEYQHSEEYKDVYVLNLGNCIWYHPAIYCEVVEDPAIEEFKESLKTKPLEVIPPQDRILLVEDGSVDTDNLDKLGIKYIVYRSGMNKPQWLECGIKE